MNSMPVYYTGYEVDDESSEEDDKNEKSERYNS